MKGGPKFRGGYEPQWCHGISRSIHRMIVIFGTHLWNDNISRSFFIFSKFRFSRLIGGKRAKNDPKWQKICLLHLAFRNHVSYDLHLWCTCMCKRIISPGNFFVFSKFWYSGSLGDNRAKMAQYDKKSVSLNPYLRNHTSYDCDFWCTGVKWWYLDLLGF